jgi:AcrR family transcriptional regulator
MNDHLLLSMRIKDIHKQEAIIDATVELVNEIGFVSSSVSKIAKKAGVSPATIYIYYKNKEDLLVSTYVGIKEKLGKAAIKNIDENKPIRDILKEVWVNLFDYISKNKEYFRFTEQFSHSPYAEIVKKEEVERVFEPIYKIVRKGIEQKIIKDINYDILSAFMFYPIITLANPRICESLKLDDNTIDTSFKLAWDAIRL